MNKTDTILSRLATQPKPEADRPDELTESIMSSLPDLGAPKAKPARRVWLYAGPAIAVAASLLLLLVLQPGNDTAADRPVAMLTADEPQQAADTQPAALPAEPAVPTEPAAQPQAATTPVPPATPQPAPARKKAAKRRKDTPQAAPPAPVASPEEQAMPAVAQRARAIIPDPTEQLMREFREQTQLIRRRGEQVALRVAAIVEQQENCMQYIEL